MGADYVEQDLQLTKDGVLVCLHDTTLERTTNVADVFPDRAVDFTFGEVRRRAWRASDFTLDEVKRLDAGSWFGSEFSGVTVPTFQEAIDLVKDRAGIYPEMKFPDEYQDLGFVMEEEIVRALAANGLASPDAQADTPVVVQSSSAESLRRLQALAGSTYPLVQLIGGLDAPVLLTDAGLRDIATYARGVGPAIPLLLRDPSRARVVRRAGLELHPHTVRASHVPDRFDDATMLMTYLIDELGATGIFTDNPDLFPHTR